MLQGHGTPRLSIEQGCSDFFGEFSLCAQTVQLRQRGSTTDVPRLSAGLAELLRLWRMKAQSHLRRFTASQRGAPFLHSPRHPG